LTALKLDFEVFFAAADLQCRTANRETKANNSSKVTGKNSFHPANPKIR
jgi:hypothetical protein